MTIHIDAARRLLDFGARIGQGRRAEEQLEGAVAIHNMLQKHKVAYLADEVGMGKTYVALGAMALFRHFDPGFRVLVIAPRENIQRKWVKELRNFAAHNVRFPDLRFSSIDRKPARPVVVCPNLLDFIRDAITDPQRDFFLRLSSFSLPVKDNADNWRSLRDRLRETLPWLPDDLFDLRSKDAFKDNFARIICCALPVFDLVIVDEGHNLKHGFKTASAARNRVLALAFGHPSETSKDLQDLGYRPKAKRVLFLSATPLEENYRHIWNQLDVFGLGKRFEELRREEADDERKKAAASKFLVRRVTTIQAAGVELTKNQYRREWRHGGVHVHDDPIRVEDDRHRLIVALVQKKVAELLRSEKFNLSFQIGMLASFESFLATARLKRAEEELEPTFDDPDQTDDDDERLGIDVRDINRLTRHYKRTFGKEMPHPKMDAVVESLRDAWTTGTKALVFVRRVASVRELKQKLDEHYDAWLIDYLRRELPDGVRAHFDRVVRQYEDEKREPSGTRRAGAGAAQGDGEGIEDEDWMGQVDDRGGSDTFFAWFFRGDGPKGVLSGANIQGRFIQRGAAYATFFEDNHVARITGAAPGGVLARLAELTNLEPDTLREKLRERAARYLSRARKHAGADRMDAAQAAALELLGESDDVCGESARIIWREQYEAIIKPCPALEAPDVGDWLEQETFFTVLREERWADLRAALWPESHQQDPVARFREEMCRAQLLATAARLGHGLIDLYILTIRRLGTLSLRAREAGAGTEQVEALDRRRIEEYLGLLELQRRTPLSERGAWGAYDELASIARHFDLILDVNAPDIRERPLAETARYFGSLLRQQQPTGGMSGQVNKTLVQQFRMPGYPFVLVTTDLLQEGEDLHTFCSSVYHYGISWTPSSMEQRIGRIDRVRSQIDRRLTALDRKPDGDDLLQVYFPFLEDTVEVLQVQRVLERMNTFLRLLHQGLSVGSQDGKRLDVGREIVRGRLEVEAIREKLESAFPVPAGATKGERRSLAVGADFARHAAERFAKLRGGDYQGLRIDWTPANRDGPMLGSARLASGRIQPFALFLRSEGEHLVVNCRSLIGEIEAEGDLEAIRRGAARGRVRIVAAPGREETCWDLSVADDVVLADPEHDGVRVGLLLKRVTEEADRLERECLGEEDRTLEMLEEHLSLEGTTDD